jgi:chloramphenicol O-acetyltransferase type A
MKDRQYLVDFFQPFVLPVFNVCAPCEVRNFLPLVKDAGIPPFAALLHCLAAASLEVENFRFRLVDGKMEEIGPLYVSHTVTDRNDNLNFCNIPFDADIATFTQSYRAGREASPEVTELRLDPDEDRSYIHVTCLPWFSFTSIQHPVGSIEECSTPAIAVGKFVPEGSRLRFPLSVQGHHGLMDGVHVHRYFEAVVHHADKLATTVQP